MTKGRLIVIEGIDGSGKSTQVDLLEKALILKGLPCEVISFPRYGQNIYADTIIKYLEGKFGSIKKVNPYLMALSFAGDRALAKAAMEKWLSEGKTVIANRYIASSKAHMGANLPQDEREDFFSWLNELEYETNGLPREDLTILLSVDPKIAQKNIAGEGPDIHEESMAHLKAAEEIYLKLAKEENWQIIECTKGDKMKSPPEIHEELRKLIGNLSV